MSKRSIVILVISTIILIIVSITVVYNEPDIEDACISSSKSITQDQAKQNDYDLGFDNLNSNIYLILTVKHLTKQDEIKIDWKRIENKTEETIQENVFNPKQDGSGKIIISLIKKNQKLTPGKYIVEVFLNDSKKITKQFYISENS